MWPKPADCKNCPDEERRFNFLQFDWGKRGGGALCVEPQGRDVLVRFLDAAGVERKKEFFRLRVMNTNGRWKIFGCQKDRRNLAVLQ